MRRHTLLSALLLLAAALPGRAHAQGTPAGDSTGLRPANDSLFRRARRMVAEGNGVAGRALVDSLLHVADPATPAYGDALYWHGALAQTAAEAERDYRRVIVEYPLAYYVDDALLAIAELEQARGDRAGALVHLQRFVHDHPASPERGIAALGAARLAFEQRDTKLGCAMIGTARASASPADVELRNQIDYYAGRCTGAATASAPSAPVASAPAPAAVTPPAPTVTSPAPPATKPSTVVANPPARREPVSTMPAPSMPTSRPTVATTPPSTAPARTPAARATPARPESGATKPAAAARRDAGARPSTMYTVQLAAYDTRPPAEQLVKKLATRGVKARVSGTARPFRVRLDFYRTRQEAVAVVASLKTRGIIGFVTEEARPPEARSP
jgi:septal ring-binding cell division protein DamX